MNLQDKIIKLRKSHALSQEELAERLGVSRQAVSKWESGQSLPDIDKIILISDFFGVTTDYLLKNGENEFIESQAEVVNNVFEDLEEPSVSAEEIKKAIKENTAKQSLSQWLCSFSFFLR